ncbi:3-hydroxyacyl-CoA dehydrogenase [Thauera sp. CAU 1555]|uniref:3-hydroxyacyl-CoA dehydrogenase n=1 Tax=Thauera sedimentorum TaxID=2767595 RepID=A0ABR9B7M2_9RHOO|nr:3-hydroxyacyl-CoA dehydrogenase [Thauera sedimentorum]MBC9071447.1 3-hydroxyacyl-CoA dehydrogenase [Thauera sedimentorum]MBD8502366.1 3-hydroxyacyl-CoA dehydrogenase [Thauera sedimentorum]
MTDINRPDLRLGIVGAGLMGRGIAQIAATAGIEVVLHDARDDTVRQARQALSDTLDMLRGKGRMTADEATAALGRIRVADALADLAGCDVVVEAVVEDLAVKRELFAALEAVVTPHCILATNTSSLSVTEVAAACRHPARVAGFHFFSPVPLMKVVEVIDGVLGDPAVGDSLMVLAQRMGHRPVRASDTPGFIVNHAGRGFLTEALRIVGENVAPFHVVDRILREAAGFRMGPFELLDLTGLDVSHPVMETIYNQYYQEARYRPSPIARQRMKAGLLGRKSGQGFYSYVDGKGALPAQPTAPALSARALWIAEGEGDVRELLLVRLKTAGVPVDEGARPAADSVCVVLPLGRDCSSCVVEAGLDPVRTVAIDPLFVDLHATLMTNPLCAHWARDAVWAAMAAAGWSVSVIRDSAGCVVQRVMAMIVNIACDMAQQGIASPEDIDCAVSLGLGYPNGPLAMGDALGAGKVLRILENLHQLSGDPRYRPSPWLARRARLNASLRTQEG